MHVKANPIWALKFSRCSAVARQPMLTNRLVSFDPAPDLRFG
jgi:hypothetical protein